MDTKKDALDLFVDHWNDQVDVHKPPYLTGELFEAFLGLLPMAQPEYALGCAIMASSLLLGPLIEHPWCRGNIYGVLMGRTATGKSCAITLIGELLCAVEESHLCSHALSSLQGLMRVLNQRSGKTLLLLDDGQQWLRVKKIPSLQSWKGQTHLGLIKLWKECRFFETAPTKSGEQMSVKDPFLCIFTTLIHHPHASTKDLNRELLQKMLIFEGHPHADRSDDIPYEFERYMLWKVRRLFHLRSSRILFEPEAKEIWRSFQKAVDELQRVFDDDPFAEVLAETPIQAMKLALVACSIDFDSNWFTLSDESMVWAIGVATLNLKKQYSLLEADGSENPRLDQRVWKRIHKTCQKEGKIPKGLLRRDCSGLSKKDRDRILDDLQAQKLIIIKPGQTRGHVITLTEQGKRAKVV